MYSHEQYASAVGWFSAQFRVNPEDQKDTKTETELSITTTSSEQSAQIERKLEYDSLS